MKAFINLLTFLKPYRLYAIIGPLFMFLEVAMDLMQPMIMQLIIDNGIANQDSSYVIKMGALMIVLAIIGLVGGIGCSIYSTKAAVNFATDIRSNAFRKIELFSGKNTDSFGTGKLITIATNDITSLQAALMMTLRIFVRGPLLFIGSIILVYVTARELFPILVCIIVFLMICIILFTKKAGKLFKQVQEAIDKVNTKLQENLAGIRVVKAFGREAFEKSGFLQVNSYLTKVNTSADQVIMALMPAMLFLINLGIIAALWFGVIKVEQGTIQVGVILAFINYLTITMNALMTSSNVLIQITRALPSAERIQQVFDMKIDIQEVDKPYVSSKIKGDVEFRNVCFSYSKNGELVLKNITFSAKQGEKIGIIGAIGSGKSTLIKLISRLYDPDSGEIFIDGVNSKEYKLENLRKSIGFVSQRATLFSGTIADNIRFGKEDGTIKEIEIATDAACATEFIRKVDDEYLHPLMQGGNNLSGGQKQRLSIARALVRKLAILIMDDSTSAVDTLSERAIQKALREQYNDTTKIIISSKLSSIIDADQILIMEDGKITGTGTHHELLKKNETYQEICRIQLGKEGMMHESAC